MSAPFTSFEYHAAVLWQRMTSAERRPWVALAKKADADYRAHCQKTGRAPVKNGPSIAEHAAMMAAADYRR